MAPAGSVEDSSGHPQTPALQYLWLQGLLRAYDLLCRHTNIQYPAIGLCEKNVVLWSVGGGIS